LQGNLQDMWPESPSGPVNAVNFAEKNWGLQQFQRYRTFPMRLLFGALRGRWICNWICKERVGNCKERNIQGKAPLSPSVWIWKEWIYPGNQEVESARNSICKKKNLQGMDFATNAHYTLCLSQFRRRLYLACYTCMSCRRPCADIVMQSLGTCPVSRLSHYDD